MRALNHTRKAFFSVKRFALYNLLAIVVGGILASIFMRPELAAGPIRIATYSVFGISSIMLAAKYISIVRRDPEGRANVFVVASCYWWISFAITGFAIGYLITARAYGLWPHWGEDLTERISYFFISGAAVGVLFKAISFQFIPTKSLIELRVSAWPLTIGKRQRS